MNWSIEIIMINSGKLQDMAHKIATLVANKNAAYGDSFSKADQFLQLLYPDGIRPDQYKDVLTIVRIFDKLMRIATSKNAFGESPYRDINGYSLLAALEEDEEHDQEHTEVPEDLHAGPQNPEESVEQPSRDHGETRRIPVRVWTTGQSASREKQGCDHRCECTGETVFKRDFYCEGTKLTE